MVEKAVENKEEKGFTLIELLVVVAILGILAAIALPQFAAYRQRAFDSHSEADLRNTITAQGAYFVDNEMFTPTTADLIATGLRVSQGVTLGLAVNAPTADAWTGSAVHPQGRYKFCYDSAQPSNGIVPVDPSAACP